MPYVSRDAQGAVTAVFDLPTGQATEQLEAGHPDIAAFRHRDSPDVVQTLALSDSDMGRVLEDLIQCLIDKGLLNLTDLPPEALNKISYRRQLRGKLSTLSGLVSSEEDKII